MEAPYLFNSKVDCNVKQLTYPKCVIQDWSISRILPELDELNAKLDFFIIVLSLSCEQER